MKKMIPANIKYTKRCAFCKYWYDPTNLAIEPKRPTMNQWLYDENAQNPCMQKNVTVKARSFCSKFECKLEYM